MRPRRCSPRLSLAKSELASSETRARTGIPRSRQLRFQRTLLRWYKRNGRAFPWRRTRNPYHVLVAEVLLQKTNSAKVSDVFTHLIAQYPTIVALARAREASIRRLIRPLGLEYRAHRLRTMARQIAHTHGGTIPRTKEGLDGLQGVGDYIAAAVLVFAYNRPLGVLDTNVIRVLRRVFGVQAKTARARTDRDLWAAASELVPLGDARDYNLAILDFAALVCVSGRPRCDECPLSDQCKYFEARRRGAGALMRE